jgi:hypothetical protein
MKRHHWILVAAVVLFATGWLLWNVLLVGQDLAAPPGTPAPAAAPR